MGRSASVFNKKSRERVARSKKTLGTAVKRITPSVPQAHAIVQANPNAPQNRPPMDRGSAESPIDRVGRFVTNIGRGSLDVGKSYTTDIVDSVGSAVTGSDSEVLDRKIRDRTLVDAYITSAFEGNLDPAFQETGRRVFEEPGRVVGEIATETAIMLGTMGFGAVVAGGRGAVMAGSKVPMVIKGTAKGAASIAGPGTGASIKAGRTLRGVKTFEHRQWNIPEKTITITKGKGDKITSETTRNLKTMDRLEIFGSKVGSKINDSNIRVPALGRIRNFYGLGNTGIALESTKAAIPNRWGVGTTQYLSTTAATDFSGKVVEFATKIKGKTVPRNQRLASLALVKKEFLDVASDLPTDRVGKLQPGDIGTRARESASLQTTGIKDDAVETVITRGNDDVDEIAARNYGEMDGKNFIDDKNFSDSAANKFLMKIGATGELDKASFLPGVHHTKQDASYLADRFLFKLGQESNVPLDTIEDLGKTGKVLNKKDIHRYKVTINRAGDSVVTEATNIQQARKEIGSQLQYHPSIQNQPTGTMQTDTIQMVNWLSGVGAQSSKQNIDNLALHGSVIANAKKVGVTPKEYAKALIDRGYVSPGMEAGGTQSAKDAHNYLVKIDEITRGSKQRFARSMIGTEDEIKYADFSTQASPGSNPIRGKESEISSFSNTLSAYARNIERIAGKSDTVSARPYGMELVDGKFTYTSNKVVEKSNYDASRKIARELINPKTGKKYTADEVSTLMPLNPNKSKSTKMTATEFTQHAFNTNFESYTAPAAKKFKVEDITQGNKESVQKLLVTLQERNDIAANIRSGKKLTDEQVKYLNILESPSPLPATKSTGRNTEPFASNYSKIIEEGTKRDSDRAMKKIYNDNIKKYIKAAKESKPGKKAWQYKADAHKAMKKDGLPVVEKQRQSKVWKDKFSSVTDTDEIQEISETINVSDVMNMRQVSGISLINQLGVRRGGRASGYKNVMYESASGRLNKGIYDYGSEMTASQLNKKRTAAEVALRKTKEWKKRPAYDAEPPLPRIDPVLGPRGQLGASLADFGKLYAPGVLAGVRTGSKSSGAVKTNKPVKYPPPNLYDAYLGKGGGGRKVNINNPQGVKREMWAINQYPGNYRRNTFSSPGLATSRGTTKPQFSLDPLSGPIPGVAKIEGTNRVTNALGLPKKWFKNPRFGAWD